MCILGIDYGEKHIGLAIASGSSAAPYGSASSLEEVVEIVEKEKIKKIVFGLPLDREDKEGRQAKKVREFAKRLSRKVQIPIEFHNETLTSKDALNLAVRMGIPKSKRKSIHHLSATIILQEYIERG